jgi:hypothetical protein
MTIQEALFVAAFCAVVYFARDAVRAWQSPEFKRDLERLRERRRIKRAARRRR